MTTIATHDSELLHARYGEAVPAPANVPLNPVLENLLNHRSVRAFETRPLAEGTVEWLVAAAQSAPSAGNRQAWSIIAVTDPEHKARVVARAGSAENQAPILQAPLLLVFVADLSRFYAIADRDGRTAEALDYFDTWLTAIIDATLAAQNAAVAAESLGLGTLYIGALRNDPEKVAAELGLQRGTFAVLGLVVGHIDDSQPIPITPRLPASAVLFHEKHGPARLDDELARFDQVLHDLAESQNLPRSGDWTKQSVVRHATAAQLRGRENLSSALHNLGFALR